MSPEQVLVRILGNIFAMNSRKGQISIEYLYLNFDLLVKVEFEYERALDFLLPKLQRTTSVIGGSWRKPNRILLIQYSTDLSWIR